MFLAGNLFLCVCVRGCLWAMMISWIIIQFFFPAATCFFWAIDLQMLRSICVVSYA
jgi:hypothetical protein